MDQETAFKIAAAFGGGIGKTGATCGAVTGALMIIGLKYGAADAADKKSKETVYDLAAGFMRDFKARNGSVICQDLLGFNISSAGGPETHVIISQRCPGFIKDAADIIEQQLRS